MSDSSNDTRRKKRDRNDDDDTQSQQPSPKINIMSLIISELGIRVQKPGVKLVPRSQPHSQRQDHPRNISLEFPTKFFSIDKRTESECVFGRYEGEYFIPGLLDFNSYNRVKEYLDNEFLALGIGVKVEQKYTADIIKSERRITNGKTKTYELKTQLDKRERLGFEIIAENRGSYPLKT